MWWVKFLLGLFVFTLNFSPDSFNIIYVFQFHFFSNPFKNLFLSHSNFALFASMNLMFGVADFTFDVTAWNHITRAVFLYVNAFHIVSTTTTHNFTVLSFHANATWNTGRIASSATKIGRLLYVQQFVLFHAKILSYAI